MPTHGEAEDIEDVLGLQKKKSSTEDVSSLYHGIAVSTSTYRASVAIEYAKVKLTESNLGVDTGVAQ